jgi:hypothetical protein
MPVSDRAAGGEGGDAAGDPIGEAAGGAGGGAAGGLDDQTGRGLAAYLLFPRPDAWAKALIAPACFLLAASSAGRLGNWAHFGVGWLVLELFIYPARYQWNDIRGIDADQAHPEQEARSRLPAGPAGRARRRSVRLSRLTAAARVLAALLIGLLTGLARQAVVLAGAVFAIAGSYEWLRASRSGSRGKFRVIAVWLAVGLGYLVRGGLGLGTAGLPPASTAMVAGLVCVTSFGIMFVLITWVLEATSYCAADGDGGWHAHAELAAKPHLAELLRCLGQPLLADRLPPGQGRSCGSDPVLRGGGRLATPWNLALLGAAASGAVLGTALARPLAGGTAAYLVVAGAGLAGAVLLGRCRTARGRWVIAVAWFPVVTGVALLAHPALPVLAGLPWLAVAGLYSTFCGWSYRDLIAARPRASVTRKDANRNAHADRVLR